MTVWNADRAEERCEFAIWVEVAGSKRHRARAVLNQVAGCWSDRGDPLGNVMWIADRG